MHDALSQFKRNINQLFGICVEILNVGRSLQQLSWSMQILANNGVVQAAKVSGGKGRPMLALVEILNHTPKEIRPEVETLEQLCAQLARVAAHSSSLVWRYHQLIATLLSSIRQGAEGRSTSVDPAIDHLRFTTPEDLERLVHHTDFTHGDRLVQSNRAYLAHLCQTILGELHTEFKHALRCLADTKRALNGLKMIGMTSRYMAFCIASEAAGLAEAEANFKNLSAEIGTLVDDLDGKTRTMKVAIDDGEDLVELLLKGHACAK